MHQESGMQDAGRGKPIFRVSSSQAWRKRNLGRERESAWKNGPKVWDPEGGGWARSQEHFLKKVRQQAEGLWVHLEETFYLNRRNRKKDLTGKKIRRPAPLAPFNVLIRAEQDRSPVLDKWEDVQ